MVGHVKKQIEQGLGIAQMCVEDAENKFPSALSPELSVVPFQDLSRSENSLACFVCLCFLQFRLSKFCRFIRLYFPTVLLKLKVASVTNREGFVCLFICFCLLVIDKTCFDITYVTIYS